MLQDISFGRLENEYKNISISPEDFVLCIRDREILAARDSQGLLALPTYQEAASWASGWSLWRDTPWQYAFRMLGRNYFLFMGTAGDRSDKGFSYQNYRSFREVDSKDTCFAAMTGWHLYQWYHSSRFCGVCAAPTVHDGRERMMRCPQCGNMIFPPDQPCCDRGHHQR